ncbi:hypothetical protein MML48_4g00018907 [Holotrichia oblita]|uniref:Uncharacterized protein n=1 Tax=Holotrichia oblita TaxID=644536 RepID=A0ACB9T6H5_HOLOL|nr:hypothetical protein MML48_4g00018907 [Holotrichia oblita]
MNAVGNYMMDGAPNGSVAFTQDKGWMDKDVFLKFLSFLDQTRPSADSPVLTILDADVSHTRSLAVISFVRENHTHLSCPSPRKSLVKGERFIRIEERPPHCTHKLQPLNVEFFKPFMTYYDAYITKWLRDHCGRTFGLYQIRTIDRPLEKNLEPATIPITSNTTFPEDELSTNDNVQPPDSEDVQPTDSEEVTDLYFNPQPSTSTIIGKSREDGNQKSSSPDSKVKVAVLDISPIPTSTFYRKLRNARSSLPSTVLTESPYKNEMESKDSVQNKQQQVKTNKEPQKIQMRRK